MDESHPLHGKEIAITGRLATLSRDEARASLQSAGAIFVHDPADSTAYLVVGQAGWPLRDDGRPTRALVAARELQEQGNLSIISEKDFLELLGETRKVENLERHYTTSQLARILGVPVGQIRAWMRIGLIRPLKVCHRLAWFDFTEVVRARALRMLTAAGVAAGRISRSIRAMRDWLPDADAMLGQIEALADGALRIRLVDGRVSDPRGQLLLDFDHEPSTENTDGANGRVVAMTPSRVDPDAERWFEEGVRMEDDGDLESAADAYRQALATGGRQPEIHFNLGNVLFALDRADQAIAHYREAVELDNEYVEAWNNLGNVLAEVGRYRDAVRAFVTALEIEPGYADVHSNLAETLVHLGLPREAREHLEMYLREDPGSPLARDVRRRLLEIAND